MKRFIPAYIICFILCTLGALFITSSLASKVWYVVAFAALLLTALVLVFIHYENRIEKLEKTVERLLKGKPDETDKE